MQSIKYTFTEKKSYCALLTNIIGSVDIFDTTGHSDSVLFGLWLRKIVTRASYAG